MTENISEKLMSQIKQGEVAMKPRWYFVIRSVVLAVVLVTVMLITVFVFGFLILALRVSGLLEMPAFGWRGFFSFLVAFPWLITLLLLILMLGVEVYARKYSFCYRLPVLGSLAAIMMIIGAAGLSLGYYLHYTCPARSTFMGSTLGHLRDAAVMPPDNLHAGFVEGINPPKFHLVTPVEEYEVLVDEDTRGLGFEVIEVGDEVVVFGPIDDGIIRAFGVKRLAPGHSLRLRQPAGGGCLPFGPNHKDEIKRLTPGVMIVPTTP